MLIKKHFKQKQQEQQPKSHYGNTQYVTNGATSAMLSANKCDFSPFLNCPRDRL